MVLNTADQPMTPESITATLPPKPAYPPEIPIRHPRYCKSPIADAILYQRLIMARCLDPKISAQSLAALVRAWDVLEERKRILRGRPLPGQLRPDLDPVQLAKAAKRARARLPHDIGATVDAEAHANEGSEEPAEEPSEPGESPS